ncbi:MAG: DUF4981 domain-containing protein [Lentisphaeria bacterium]|nr:MAG: DUF4981 domain-containing protein [Lentisphaeria bacterium]
MIAIVNRRCFTDLSDCELEWEVTVDGRSVATGKAALPPHGPEHFIPDFAGAERHDIFNEEPHNCFELKLPVREPAGLRAGRSVSSTSGWFCARRTAGRRPGMWWRPNSSRCLSAPSPLRRRSPDSRRSRPSMTADVSRSPAAA